MARFSLALTALLVFTAYTLHTLANEGVAAIFELFAGGWSQQLFIDLFIACGVCTFWIIPDAKKHGISPWPFVIALPFVGSVASLTYITVREWKRARVPALAAA